MEAWNSLEVCREGGLAKAPACARIGIQAGASGGCCFLSSSTC